MPFLQSFMYNIQLGVVYSALLITVRSSVKVNKRTRDLWIVKHRMTRHTVQQACETQRLAFRGTGVETVDVMSPVCRQLETVRTRGMFPRTRVGSEHPRLNPSPSSWGQCSL